MNRSNFLKSLATFIAAPSIIENIDFKENKTKGNQFKHFENGNDFTANYGILVPQGGSMLFQDLNLLMPKYYEDIQKKYGSEQYAMYLNTISK